MANDRSGDAIVAGHICLDLIPAFDGAPAIEPGRLVKIGPAIVTTGGVVANTGLALHKLGTPVRLMGKTGDDEFGRIVMDVLRSHGPCLADDMIVADGESTSYSIVISPPDRDRTFWHCPGANDTFSADDVPYDNFGSARFFHFGYPPVMARMYRNGGAELADLLGRARERGVAVGLDMCSPDSNSDAGRIDWAALLARVLPNVDVFFPSIDELLYMLDRPAFDRLARNPEDAVDGQLIRTIGERLMRLGVAAAVIKLGDRGLYVRTSDENGRIEDFCRRLGLNTADWKDREIYAPCFSPSKVAGTTGSGDCTIAGFIASILRGEDPTTAATSAVAVGACSVEAADATGGVRPWDEVKARLEAGWQRSSRAIAWPTHGLAADRSGTLSLNGNRP